MVVDGRNGWIIFIALPLFSAEGTDCEINSVDGLIFALVFNLVRRAFSRRATLLVDFLSGLFNS